MAGLNAVPLDAAQDLARDWGLVLDHPAQAQFLAAGVSVDVQAAPGSGKTTLTGLKLCAMAREWAGRDRGILVLSHTNTAKDLIKQVVQRDRWGRTLLRAPHFVGTIQSFIDVYLGLPMARSMGFGLHIVDDDTFASVAATRIRWARFRKLENYLARRSNGEDLIQQSVYVYDSMEGLGVGSEAGALPFGAATPSGRQFASLKRSLALDGYFRFSDMYAFASNLLEGWPEVVTAVRRRFPWVVIDEMQDVSGQQQRVLDALFASDEIVLQRIGDENQRILGSGTDSAVNFPCDRAIELPVSRRFGSSIASTLSPLTIRRQQLIFGNPERNPDHVALILFDEPSATAVLPAFASLAQELIPVDVLQRYPLKAVGGRRSRSSSDRFPQAIGSYGLDAAESPVRTSATRRPGHLAGAVAVARRHIEAGATAAAVSTMWEAMGAIAELAEFGSPSRRWTGVGLSRWLRRTGPRLEQEARRIIRSLVEEGSLETADAWEASVQIVFAWSLLQGAEPVEELKDYCRHRDVEFDPVPEAAPVLSGIQVDTIHNVKGETHSGTLVLECLDRSGKVFDVVEALSVIAGTSPASRVARKTVSDVCQLMFVAASRPQSLLTFAAMAEHVEGPLAVLAGRGWRIDDARR